MCKVESTGEGLIVMCLCVVIIYAAITGLVQMVGWSTKPKAVRVSS